jgi:type I restriction enzyme S subunit
VVRLVKETCKDPVSEGIERVIGLEHIEPGDLRVCRWADITDGTTFTSRVRPGQVLFGKRRAYQRKVAVANFHAVCSGDIYVFESADSTQLLPELLPFLCQTDSFFEYAIGTSVGSLSPRTNWSSLTKYEFALPTMEEQKRIASLLTSSSTLVMQLQYAFDAYLSIADRMIDALIEGNLSVTPEELRAGIDPKGWRLCSLSSLCNISNGHGFRPTDWAESGMPIIRIQNVRGSRTFNYFAGTPDPKWIVQPGELLFSWAGVPGVSFGPGIWEGPPAVLNQHIYRVTPCKGIDRLWLFEVLRYLTPRIERKAHGFKSSLLHIKQAEFKGQRVLKPSTIEQEKVVHAIRMIRGWGDHISLRLSEAKQIRQRALLEVMP